MKHQPPHRLVPRPPTEAERRELVALTFDRLFPDIWEQEPAELVAHAAIAVFDDYVTSSPGYAGKVMVVVWDNAPTETESYIWCDSRLMLSDALYTAV